MESYSNLFKYANIYTAFYDRTDCRLFEPIIKKPLSTGTPFCDGTYIIFALGNFIALRNNKLVVIVISVLTKHFREQLIYCSEKIHHIRPFVSRPAHYATAKTIYVVYSTVQRVR